jgi:hypothetical protein
MKRQFVDPRCQRFHEHLHWQRIVSGWEADPNRAGQGRKLINRAEQVRTGSNRFEQGRTGPNKFEQGRTGPNRLEHVRTGSIRTYQGLSDPVAIDPAAG